MLGLACALPPGMAPTVVTIAAAAMTVTRLFRPLSTSGRSPLHVVRLPGELTGSGTTGPTPPPRPRTLVHRRLDGDSPQKGWFPGSSSQPRAATKNDSARLPHGHRTGPSARGSERRS